MRAWQSGTYGSRVHSNVVCAVMSRDWHGYVIPSTQTGIPSLGRG